MALARAVTFDGVDKNRIDEFSQSITRSCVRQGGRGPQLCRQGGAVIDNIALASVTPISPSTAPRRSTKC